MRILAASIGALLISVSHPALAQKHDEQSAEAGRAATTVEDILAQLPERPLAETAEERLAMTAEQVLAQLPERRLARPMEEPAPVVTAERVLAQLPERRLGDEAAPSETDEARRQPEALKAEMQEDHMTETDMPADPRWAALKEPNLGSTLDLPRGVFAKSDGHAHKGAGRRYRTADGRARVAVWTQRNTRRDTPASYLRRTFAIPLATLDYQRSTPEFAVVSGSHRGRVFYLRCNLSSRGNFHCIDLAYPARETKAWDHVVTRMSRSLRAHDE